MCAFCLWLCTGLVCVGSGGENISSIEVENILHTHPSVSEAAVRPSPPTYLHSPIPTSPSRVILFTPGFSDLLSFSSPTHPSHFHS